MPAIQYQPSMTSNQNGQPVVASAEEVAKLFDAAVPRLARQIIAALPPKDRDASETQFLFDCARGRRAATRETLARLALLSGRARKTFVADMLGAVECQHAPAIDGCLLEASMDLEEADVAVDRARVAYAKEPTPTRAAVMWECLCQLGRMAQQVTALAAKKMPHLKTQRVG